MLLVLLVLLALALRLLSLLAFAVLMFLLEEVLVELLEELPEELFEQELLMLWLFAASSTSLSFVSATSCRFRLPCDNNSWKLFCPCSVISCLDMMAILSHLPSTEWSIQSTHLFTMSSVL